MTTFREGDIVKFIDEVGGGKILKVLGEDSVLLLDDNGFDYEVESSRLMLVKPAGGKKKKNNKPASHKTVSLSFSRSGKIVEQKMSSSASIEDIKETTLQKYETTKIVLAFVPENNNTLIADLNLYLINDSPYKLHYQIAVKKETAFTTVEDGMLEANTQLLISTISRKQLLSLKELIIRGILVLPSFIKEGKPFEEIIKIKPVRFTREGSYKKNEYFDMPSILHYINPVRKQVEFPENYDKKYTSDRKTDKLPGRFTSEKVEIDLHIENLEKNYRQLTPDQMLSIQLSHFVKVLEKALISDTVKYLVIIHGVGNGKLKTSIRKILREDYPALKFSDAPFEEYGYGATLIKIL